MSISHCCSEYHYAECHHANSCYAGSHIFLMLTLDMPNVAMLDAFVVLLSYIMLSVFMLKVVMLGVTFFHSKVES